MKLSKNPSNLFLTATLVMACWVAALDRATAEPYPTRPLKIIVPASVGSPPDAVGRIVGQRLAERLGQSVIVENQPGAGTTIATRAAATAAPDGYTLLQINSAFAYAPVLYPNPGYDTAKSFAPVAAIADWSLFMVVPADVPASTIQELITYAKSNPGRINIGHTLGSPPQILAQIFKAASGVEFNTVPYRQVSQLTSDLLSGRIQMFFGAGAGLMSLVQQGKLKALAYTGMTRHPALPLVPTAIESKFPQLALNPSDWTGIVAPAGTPRAVVDTLNAAINDVLGSQEIRASIARQGGDIKIASPAEFSAFLAAEAKKWPQRAKEAGLKPD